MTMKKRFLGLALAAMVAVPATTAYANTTATVEGSDSQTLDHTVKVSGTVSTNAGIAPEGKIQVELPTAMSFAVDERSNLVGGNYTVKNKSNKAITLSVAEFRQSSGNISVEDTSSFQPSTQDRSHVFLSLDGRVDSSSTSVDLGSFIKDTSGAEVEILDVAASDSAVMTLSGEAGTQAASGNVDTAGATGEFALVFKIKKKS